MCLYVCCTLSGICDSIFVVYVEVIEKANFTEAERFDNTFHLEVFVW